MTTPLTLATSRRADGRSVVTATGEIDMTNTDALAGTVDAALADATGPLVIDLTAVGYLDSAGLSVLLARADRIEILAPPLLMPVLTFAGLAELTTVHTADASDTS